MDGSRVTDNDGVSAQKKKEAELRRMTSFRCKIRKFLRILQWKDVIRALIVTHGLRACRKPPAGDDERPSGPPFRG